MPQCYYIVAFFTEINMRKDSRDAVYKILFSKIFNDVDDAEFKNYIYEEDKLSAQDKAFANELIEKITENKQQILDDIQLYSKDYKLDRIYNADKCALMIGFCELKYFPQTPPIVAIDEAVNLARKYSTENSVAFVNGVLAKYKKVLEGIDD